MITWLVVSVSDATTALALQNLAFAESCLRVDHPCAEGRRDVTMKSAAASEAGGLDCEVESETPVRWRPRCEMETSYIYIYIYTCFFVEEKWNCYSRWTDRSARLMTIEDDGYSFQPGPLLHWGTQLRASALLEGRASRASHCACVVFVCALMCYICFVYLHTCMQACMHACMHAYMM